MATHELTVIARGAPGRYALRSLGDPEPLNEATQVRVLDLNRGVLYPPKAVGSLIAHTHGEFDNPATMDPDDLGRLLDGVIDLPTSVDFERYVRG